MNCGLQKRTYLAILRSERVHDDTSGINALANVRRPMKWGFYLSNMTHYMGRRRLAQAF